MEGISGSQFKALAVQFEDIAGGEIAVTNLVTVGTPVGGAVISDGADQIWRWDTAAATWMKYFYRKQRTTIYGWCKAGEETKTNDTIPAGEGFFFRRGSGQGEDVITFSASSAE